MSGVFDFSFNDDDKVPTRAKRFKAEKDKSYRVSFAGWKTDSEGFLIIQDDVHPNFKGCLRHFVEGKGYILNPGKDGGAEYTKLLGEPKFHVATVIVVWPSDKDGKPDFPAISRGGYEVFTWIFDKKKYNSLRSSQSDYPFSENDLYITCTEDKFQQMTFANKKKNILREIGEQARKKPELRVVYDKIVEDVQNALAGLEGELGVNLSLAGVRRVVNGATIGEAIRQEALSSAPDDASDVDMSADENIEGVLDAFGG